MYLSWWSTRTENLLSSRVKISFFSVRKHKTSSRQKPCGLSLFVSPSRFTVWWRKEDFTQLTQSGLLSASGNRICSPPATTRPCPGLHSTTKPVWPPHQSNSRSLLNMSHLRLLICIPVSLKLPLCFVVLQQVHFVGILFLMLLPVACGWTVTFSFCFLKLLQPYTLEVVTPVCVWVTGRNGVF